MKWCHRRNNHLKSKINRLLNAEQVTHFKGKHKESLMEVVYVMYKALRRDIPAQWKEGIDKLIEFRMNNRKIKSAKTNIAHQESESDQEFMEYQGNDH